MMKIAHVVDSMEVGGVETLVAQMCTMQRELGHEPIVFVLGAVGSLGTRMLREGFDVGGCLRSVVFRELSGSFIGY